MPGKPFQSKLEPYYEFIREARIKRWSYRKIAEALGSEHGLSVSANAIFSFVKVRAKRCQLYALPPADPLAPTRVDITSNLSTARDFFGQPQPSKESLPHEKKRRPYNI